VAVKAKQKGTALWSIAVVILTSPLYFLFNYFGKAGTGRAAWLSTGMILIAIKVRWELKKHVWFWTTIAGIVALHVPLILFFPWTAEWVPAFVIFPFCVVDLVAILTFIQFIEKRVGPSQSHEEVTASEDLDD
jgi:hypothetical protein